MPSKGNAPIAVRMSEQERAIVEDAAAELKVPAGVYLRDSALRRACGQLVPVDGKGAPTVPGRPERPRANSVPCKAHPGTGLCEHGMRPGAFCRVSGRVVT